MSIFKRIINMCECVCARVIQGVCNIQGVPEICGQTLVSYSTVLRIEKCHKRRSGNSSFLRYKHFVYLKS